MNNIYVNEWEIKADINNIREYASALLDSEEKCWDCDPVLIDEYWAGKVHEFLKHLAKEEN